MLSLESELHLAGGAPAGIAHGHLLVGPEAGAQDLGQGMGVVQLLVVTLLGIGMIRARVLPVPAVALFTLAPAATVAVAALLTVMGLDAARYAPIGVVAFAVGFAWVGWAMWREPALDLRSPNGGPLAA